MVYLLHEVFDPKLVSHILNIFPMNSVKKITKLENKNQIENYQTNHITLFTMWIIIHRIE